MELRFPNRGEAGRRLVELLGHYADSDAIVLALQRGGIAVGNEVARALGLTLDLFVVRPIGAPGDRERTLGAVASGGISILDAEAVKTMGLPAPVVDLVTAQEARELVRADRHLRGDRPPPLVRGRVVILVDDGTSEATALSTAIAALNGLGTARIVVALPAATPRMCTELLREADEVVCGATATKTLPPKPCYDDGASPGDDEVRKIIALSALARGRTSYA